ncbi:MAG: hypothetical protein JWO67_6159 [Streptosporangiaceae bacterium]|nr:hypothetical protein [Streptosporangiaceae bacterium]
MSQPTNDGSCSNCGASRKLCEAGVTDPLCVAPAAPESRPGVPMLAARTTRPTKRSLATNEGFARAKGVAPRAAPALRQTSRDRAAA